MSEKDALIKKLEAFSEERYPKADNWSVTSKSLVFDISLPQFFNNFISNEGGYNLIGYLESIPDFYDVEKVEWEADNSILLKWNIKISGVPFQDKTKAEDRCTIREHSKEVLILECTCITADLVMYSQTFKMHEAWIILQDAKNAHRVVYKRLLQVEFTESTMFEYIIRKSLEYNNVKNTSMWTETARKRGLLEMPEGLRMASS